MALWFDPFGKGREEKLESRLRFDQESGNFFITTALAPRGESQVFDDKEKLVGPITTRVENSRGSAFLDEGVLLPDRRIPGTKYFENSSASKREGKIITGRIYRTANF